LRDDGAPGAGRETARDTSRRRALMGKVVYVLDGWNDTTQTSVVAVYATREKAERALERLLKRPGDWYAGVVKRVVR
jgi:hypothetical protein